CIASNQSVFVFLTLFTGSVAQTSWVALQEEKKIEKFEGEKNSVNFWVRADLDGVSELSRAEEAPGRERESSAPIENAMFLNKMKEQLGPDKNPSFPHSSSHYPTAVLTVPGSVTMEAAGRAPKQEGGGGSSLASAGLVITTPQGTLVSPPSSSQSFVSGHPTTTMIVSTLHAPNPDKKEDVTISPAVVMPTPSKRGRKKKSALPRTGPAGHPLPTGSDALILAHLASGGQVLSLLFTP
ncbi:hypothetical protein JZ751_009505, partial [Albula glossodonta]